MMMKVAETAGKTLKLDKSYIWSVESHYIAQVQTRLEFHEAKKLIEDKFSHHRRMFGMRNPHTLSMQIKLAHIYMTEAFEARKRREKAHAKTCEDEAEKIYTKLVDMGRKNPRDFLRNGIYISALEGLGKVYFAKHESQKAQACYCEALEWCAYKFGDDSPSVILLLREFKALQRLGELGLVKVKMEPGEDLKGPSVATIRREPSQDEAVCDEPICETFEESNIMLSASSEKGAALSLEHARSDAFIEGYRQTTEGEAHYTTSDTPWLEQGTSTTVVLHRERHFAEADDNQFSDGVMPWVVENIDTAWMAVPTADTPDFYPVDLFGEDMQMDEVNELFKGQESL